MLRFLPALLVLALFTGCEEGKKQEETPAAPSFTVPQTFENWKKIEHNGNTYHTSPDENIVIVLGRDEDKNVSTAAAQLNSLAPPHFSMDQTKETTIGGLSGQAVEMTYSDESGHPPIKFQFNLLQVGADLIRISIALPAGEASFLTNPDQWPAFLEGISFPGDE